MRGDRGFPVRLRFTKGGPVRFISHRDVARAFERAFRIERAPLAFTEGFVPRPRVSFGLGLPTGYESEAEYLDAELTEEVDLARFAEAVSASLPEGMDVAGEAFLLPRAASLQEAVTAASYLVEALPRPGGSAGEPALDPADVTAWVQQVLRSERLEGRRRRKGREVVEDLRPAIRELSMVGTTSRGVQLELEVLTQPRSVRPEEVLRTLTADAGLPGTGGPPGPELVEGTIVRIEQWIERDGSRLTPLEADTRPRAGIGTR